MTLDLSKAIWEGTRAIRAIPNYAEDATTSDMAAAAIRAALPHIIEALADWAENDPESEWAMECVSPDWWLRAKLKDLT